jgi:electron transport complex protein RnfE
VKALKTITNGIFKENPTLRLVLGTCPTLAITTSTTNVLGMGVAATFVLVMSNMIISLLRKQIPDKVRIPAYITIIAGFVSIVEMIMKAFLPELDKALGIYIPLIVVNCIILVRAELFASKNNVFYSALDGIGMGLGFTLALLLIASFREILGNGTWFGMNVTRGAIDPAMIMILPPGGFIAFGTVVAIINKFSVVKVRKTGCAACTMGCPTNCSKEVEA